MATVGGRAIVHGKMPRALTIRVGFSRYVLAGASERDAGSAKALPAKGHRGGPTAGRRLGSGTARAIVRRWAATAPGALRDLRHIYGDPSAGPGDERAVQGLLLRLERDLASGRVMLVVPAATEASESAFARAHTTSAPTPETTGFAPAPPAASDMPGSVAPAAATSAASEPDPSDPLAFDVETAAQVRTLVAAAQSGAPFCEECARRAAAS